MRPHQTWLSSVVALTVALSLGMGVYVSMFGAAGIGA